ncbi:BTB/POZ domain-containing protein KCTD21-like [Octopus bimaculoides]|uniref:BTB domain-containing protein n=1 Tax=Octopus bimaculoides TaxID=37653 RepID=A0A0L8FZB8_OCTBM|nr:BTB/POZ domain-containing protein KCTD21-like [Octopus bimaculoides]XP_052824785.1 BTB/POZ domain-containing protein KCTD21-like [Octopus bimaculoides]|eukprot:XP_014785805.1 PREDICTED: BTB/POZ domain-containing protein KCTD21-like [Octopus bimaculoides]
MAEDIVNLNVGGTHYSTTRSTLCQYADSMLGTMFSGSYPTTIDKSGFYFIDRDGFMFRYILNFLRSKKLSLPMDFKEYDLLLTEADFYQIKPLIQDLCKLRDDLADKSGGVFLEIIEVRTGSTATMPTNNSRVKTILSGRKDMIISLPSNLIGKEALEKLQTKNGLEFAEIELNGSNIRLRLGEYLKNCGWEMVDSQLSSSSGYDAKALISSLIIEQSYRDRWCLFSRRKSQAFSHTSLN